MVNNYSIGTDPELFLEKNNEIVSAEGIIGGSKQEPKKISDEGHAIQEDNVMVEFNIPPCKDVVNFKKHINFVKDYLKTLVALFGCTLNYSASAVLDSKYLNTEQAKMFGCEPDYNVYLKEVNQAPNSRTNLRTCGGHIHIGYDEPCIETSEKIIYAMDAVLGLESIALDKDDRRREMYGKAGCFRFKDYGVEYRTLSNFWIKTDLLMEWAFKKTVIAIELVNSEKIDIIIEKYSNDIKNAIDNNDKEKALFLIESINILINTNTKKEVA